MSLNNEIEINGIEIDMNALFNFNYNFDILKFVIEGIIKSQKSLQEQLILLSNDNFEKEKIISSIEKELIEIKLIQEKEPNKVKELLERKETLKNKQNSKPILNENKSLINLSPSKVRISKDLIEEESRNKNNFQTISNQIKDLSKNTSQENFNKQPSNLNFNTQEIKNINEKINIFENEINELKNSINSEIENIDDKIKVKINEALSKYKKETSKEYIENNEKLNQQIKEISESYPLKIRQSIKPINDNIEILKTDITNIESSVNFKISQYDKNIQDVKNKFSDFVNKMKELNEKFVYYALLTDIKKAKDEIQTNINNDISNLRIEISFQKKSFENLKLQVLEFINDQTDHDDLQNLRKKFESIMSTIYLLQDFTREYSQKEKEKPIFDPLKFININQFNEYKIGIVKQFDKTKNSIEDTKYQLTEITEKELKNKVSYRDLKNLEDTFLIKLEDLKLIFTQKFSDKKEVNKNIKYLDQQIKQISDLNKKSEKNDSWLISKKPYGHLCASCEAYLGDLKESTQYVPWNKYPIKDPNDKLYRVGAGFSKMLSIVSVDNNNNNNNNNTNINNNNNNNNYKDNNLNHSYSTNNVNFSKIKNKDFNNSNISNFNNDIINEENESKSLPKISQFKKAIIEGKDEIVNSPFDEQLIKEDAEKDKPKM